MRVYVVERPFPRAEERRARIERGTFLDEGVFTADPEAFDDRCEVYEPDERDVKLS